MLSSTSLYSWSHNSSLFCWASLNWVADIITLPYVHSIILISQELHFLLLLFLLILWRPVSCSSVRRIFSNVERYHSLHTQKVMLNTVTDHTSDRNESSFRISKSTSSIKIMSPMTIFLFLLTPYPVKVHKLHLVFSFSLFILQWSSVFVCLFSWHCYFFWMNTVDL